MPVSPGMVTRPVPTTAVSAKGASSVAQGTLLNAHSSSGDAITNHRYARKYHNGPAAWSAHVLSNRPDSEPRCSGYGGAPNGTM